MRAFAVVFVAFAACNSSSTVAAPPVQTTTTATSTSTSTSAVPSGAPLFTYVEGGDELTFTSPTSLRLVRARDGGTRTCASNLSTGNDNMWTGPDVENAFLAADVQAVLRGGTVTYFPEIDDSGVVTEATLRTSKGTIEWKFRPCRFCVPPSPALLHLRRVLTGVMMNRRLLCP